MDSFLKHLLHAHFVTFHYFLIRIFTTDNLEVININGLTDIIMNIT